VVRLHGLSHRPSLLGRDEKDQEEQDEPTHWEIITDSPLALSRDAGVPSITPPPDWRRSHNGKEAQEELVAK
jgi:hypothetical protein